MQARTIRLTQICTVLAAMVCLPHLAGAAPVIYNITFPGPDGVTLQGRLYRPYLTPTGYHRPGIIMMHGCSGMWSSNDPQTGVAQNHIEKWGIELASQGYVALAVDSYTTRTPEGEDEIVYQDQCQKTGNQYAGDVDPYTTRVDDIAAAKSYLISAHGVNPTGVGLLGWSQGAESVMIHMAATPPDEDVEFSNDPILDMFRVRAAVTFYPGCGPDLGFGFTYGTMDDGYWRPINPIRVNHGEDDDLFTDCERRKDNAWLEYGAMSDPDELEWGQYPGASHSFDHENGSTAFPTSRCVPYQNDNQCAMRDADIDSLAFLEAYVTGMSY